RTDRLEMSTRDEFPFFVLDCDRLDPMDRILENEQIAQPQDELMWQQGIRRRGSKVKKERTRGFQDSPDVCGPLVAPIKIAFAILLIRVTTVRDSQIVGR